MKSNPFSARLLYNRKFVQKKSGLLKMCIKLEHFVFRFSVEGLENLSGVIAVCAPTGEIYPSIYSGGKNKQGKKGKESD